MGLPVSSRIRIRFLFGKNRELGSHQGQNIMNELKKRQFIKGAGFVPKKVLSINEKRL